MASGNTLLVFTPQANEPTATNYATLDTRNGHWVLDFATATNERAIFSSVMPRNYSGGGITTYLHWAASTATATSVTGGWLVAFERIGDSVQDLDSDGFAADNTATAVAVPATSGHVKISNVTFTDGADMDSVAVGEAFRLRVARDVANDTAGGDLELLKVELKET